MSEHIFKDGCMWEGDEWKEVKHHMSAYNKYWVCISVICWTEKVWICPSVIVAYNEGHNNSTGMCLQCVLDAAATLSNKA